MCTCLDEAISNVTQTLRETGLYENTIIIFMSGKKGIIYDNNNSNNIKGVHSELEKASMSF